MTVSTIRRSKEADDLTVFKVTGDVDAKQIIPAIIDFLITAPTRYVIWDITNGSMRRLGPADLRTIVERGSPHTSSRAGGRTAIVCGNDLDFGLSRMFEVFAEQNHIPFEIRVFRDGDEARQWIAEARKK